MEPSAHPTRSSAAASLRGAAIPSLELMEARQFRDALKDLLRKEQAAMADFLIALADFDRRRGWEPLGHASLFAFLHFALGLSNSAAYYRMSAARLIQRIPGLVEPIGSGRLCLSTTAELIKVVTAENWTEVAPRFFGLSAREAREVVAELQPREAPPMRTVVTSLAPPLLMLGPPRPTPPGHLAKLPGPSTCSPPPARSDTDPGSLLTPEVDLTHPVRVVAPRDDVEPLTAELRRLHVTVSRQFLKKLDAARDGLSHAVPCATAEQVLERALDLLLEKQARAHGLVKRPRAKLPTATPTPTPTAPAFAGPASPPLSSSAAPRPVEVGPAQPLILTEPPPVRRLGPRCVERYTRARRRR